MNETLTSETQDRIARFLLKQGIGPARDPRADLELDSYTTVLLIDFMEKELGVRLHLEDIDAAAFRSIESITSLAVRRLRGSRR